MTNVVPDESHRVALSDVIVTPELDCRPAPEINHQQVTRAIQELAARMVEGPEQVLPRFVDLAMALGDGISSGISISEPECQPPQFRWAFLKGTLSAFEGATTPRNNSPCGVTLDADQPILARHAERYYSWISDAGIVVPEVLLVPLHRGSELLGTLWIVSDRVGHFHRGHVTAICELASFVSVALQMLQTERRLESALAEQEALTGEMSHRVKNLFHIVQGMIQLSSRSADSKEQLAEALAGRVNALKVAHGLIRRTFSPNQTATSAAELMPLVRALLQPHEASRGRASRVKLRGPVIPLGERATNGLGLIFHELATNAAKYGALSQEGGTVEVAWLAEDADLVVTWTERGGPVLSSQPTKTGFGTRLLRDTIEQGLGGTFHYQWNPEGAVISMQLPLARLKF
jgi:two-component sensor histidine kinase